MPFSPHAYYLVLGLRQQIQGSSLFYFSIYSGSSFCMGRFVPHVDSFAFLGTQRAPFSLFFVALGFAGSVFKVVGRGRNIVDFKRQRRSSLPIS